MRKPLLTLPRTLVTLAALTLLTMVVLIWQAVTGAREHLEAAQGVLRDYAELAATQYGRLLRGSVGFGAIYGASRQITGPREALAKQIEQYFAAADAPPAQQQARQLIGAVFVASGSGLEVLHGAVPEAVAAELAAALRDASFERPGFAVVQFESAQGPQIAALLERESGVGVWLDDERLASFYAQTYASNALLPEVLREDQSRGNDGIFLRFMAPGGTLRFESPGQVLDPYVASRVPFDSDYGGLFSGYAILASIDADRASDLLIGGVPQARLPMLVLLVAGAIGLLVMTLAVWRRERTLIAMREEFVAQVSHELRTPLTQIRMAAETLLLDRAPDQAQRRRFLAMINREAARLGHLVENILSFSRRAGTSEPVLIREDLAPMLHEIRDSFAPLLDANGDRLEIACDPGLAVEGDRTALQQVIFNLLDNAIKYGPAEQVIRLSARAAGDAVEIALSDEGPGIPEADCERIWRPYERLARDQERAIGGTGLGLCVAQELMKAMNGAIEADPTVRRGARFVLRLRRAA